MSNKREERDNLRKQCIAYTQGIINRIRPDLSNGKSNIPKQVRPDESPKDLPPDHLDALSDNPQ